LIGMKRASFDLLGLIQSDVHRQEAQRQLQCDEGSGCPGAKQPRWTQDKPQAIRS